VDNFPCITVDINDIKKSAEIDIIHICSKRASYENQEYLGFVLRNKEKALVCLSFMGNNLHAI
jgi:hypothetical protein